MTAKTQPTPDPKNGKTSAERSAPYACPRLPPCGTKGLRRGLCGPCEERHQRVRLAAQARVLVAELRDLAEAAAATEEGKKIAREAEAVASEALNVLVLQEPGTEHVHKAYRAMFGGRPDDDDGIRIRRLGAILSHAAEEYRAVSHPKKRSRALPAQSLDTMRQGFPAEDAAFASLSESSILDAIKKVANGGSLPGALTDLMIEASALGTYAHEDRSDVQGRITKRLKPR